MRKELRSGQQVVRRGSERVEVRPAVNLLAHQLLWGAIGPSPLLIYRLLSVR